MVDVTIRFLQDRDSEKIKENVKEFISYIAQLCGKRLDDSPKKTESIVNEFLSSDSSTQVIVAESDGKIDGFLSYFPAFWVEENTKSYMVSAFSVSSKKRGSGLGKKLFSRLVSQAKTNGVGQVILTVHHNNEGALKFYDKFGLIHYEDERIMLVDF
tara:strand:+ start:536 stop:1006 length:471 start_codon:yes stop_codon:yes gene_type:complete